MEDFIENLGYYFVKTVIVIISSILGLFGLFVLYAVIVYTPVSILAEDACLSKGYPKSYVTYDLDRYCMNLEGTVTVKVKELD